MSMEYHPVEGIVADQAVRDWRDQNYDDALAADPNNSLHTVAEYIDEVLMAASGGLSYHADGDVAEIRCEREYSESEVAPFCFNWIETSVNIVYQQAKKLRPVREQYSIDVSHYDQDGEYLSGVSYMIVKFVGGKMDMMVQRSMDTTAAMLVNDVEYLEKAPDRWSGATEYDATQLFDELSRLQALYAPRWEAAA